MPPGDPFGWRRSASMRAGPRPKRFFCTWRGRHELRLARSLDERVAAADWGAVARALDEEGGALLPQLLTPDECAALAALYESGEPERFRATVDMARHRFGSGPYKYFAAPLPEPVEALRQALYPRLLPIAQDWYASWAGPEAPVARVAGRVAGHLPPGRPEQAHPAAAPLRARRLERPAPRPVRRQGVPAAGRDQPRTIPGADHDGGEFLLVEQRPRAQSRGSARPVAAGPRAGLHHPRPPGALGPRLVGGAGPARRLGDPVRAAGTPWACSSTTRHAA